MMGWFRVMNMANRGLMFSYGLSNLKGFSIKLKNRVIGISGRASSYEYWIKGSVWVKTRDFIR